GEDFDVLRDDGRVLALGEDLVDGDPWRAGDEAEAALVVVVVHRTRRDDAPRAGVGRQAGALAGALAAVEEAGRRDEVDALDELAFLLVGHQQRLPAEGGYRIGAPGTAEATRTLAVLADRR